MYKVFENYVEAVVKFSIHRIFFHGINVYFLLRYLSSAVDKEFFLHLRGRIFGEN